MPPSMPPSSPPAISLSCVSANMSTCARRLAHINPGGLWAARGGDALPEDVLPEDILSEDILCTRGCKEATECMSPSADATRDAALDFGARIMTTSLVWFPVCGCRTPRITAECTTPKSSALADTSSIPSTCLPSMVQIMSPIPTKLLAAALVGSRPVTTSCPLCNTTVIPMPTCAQSPLSLLYDERLLRPFLLFLLAGFRGGEGDADAGSRQMSP